MDNNEEVEKRELSTTSDMHDETIMFDRQYLAALLNYMVKLQVI